MPPMGLRARKCGAGTGCAQPEPRLSSVLRLPDYAAHEPMLRLSRRLTAPITATLVALVLSAGCRSSAPVVEQQPAVAAYDPSKALGAVFQDVQLAGVFPDSKTFVDARPLLAPADIAARYDTLRRVARLDLRAYVEANFEIPKSVGEGFRGDTSRSMEEHIKALWPILTRQPDKPDPHSSLLPLPYAYVVPGGRFREVYYWDSYFTMLGLVESGRTDLVKSMLDNFAHLVMTVGHIPNGNRSYYLSRSQPPFFAAMVGLYARATDTTQALRYLEAF
jgi:alpha,alpha-trehalase